jgi:erythromycin esterase
METIHALLVVVLVIACFFSYFGGFGTGKCADTEEFAKYAGTISDISVPAQARVIGLGEATHGNIEFQQLKLEVFKVMVEKYGVRAFALGLKKMRLRDELARFLENSCRFSA